LVLDLSSRFFISGSALNQWNAIEQLLNPNTKRTQYKRSKKRRFKAKTQKQSRTFRKRKGSTKVA
jgi:hypothetical protein